jgi:hypothetical protein
MQRSAAMSLNRTQIGSLAVLASLAQSLTGCAVIGGIFKAGVWVGVIAVVLVIALLLGIVRLIAGAG